MDWQGFEERLLKRMKEEHIPGLAIAVSKDGKIVYEKGFGVRDFKTNRPATPETMFGTASVTKSFTALAIMKLVESGKISLDDSVRSYLPSFDIQGVESVEAIKIHHLLTHTTGLAPIERREDLNQFDEHVAYLREERHDLLGKPGKFFSYSNDAFLLLGAIIEKVTGRLYRRYMTEEILYPLQMKRSTFSIEELQKMCNVAAPYIFDETKAKHERQDWPQLGNYEVGGGIRSSVRDLMKYGALYLNQGKLGTRSFISSDLLKDMYVPRVEVSPATFYGYGFKLTPDYHGTTLVEHSGGQPGVASNFGFIPEENVCVAVLTNVSGASAGDIWLEAFNQMLGLPHEAKRYHLEETFQEDVNLKRYIGHFFSQEGDKINVNVKHNNLIAHMDGETYSLKIGTEDNLLIFENTNKPLQYFFDDKGEAWAVFQGMRMLLRQSIINFN